MMRSEIKSYFTYFYAGFLVFITPLAIPFAIYDVIYGQVDSKVWILTITLYLLSGLGITLGYHRLLTHRSFETYGWMKRLLLIFGSMAMQGPAASWASLHIQHHRFSDQEGDPHSPQIKGFWHAHCGWLFRGYRPDFTRYGKWLLKDPHVKHVTKYYFQYSLLGLLIPIALAGWQGFIWAGCLRLCLSSHATWSVNSLCHAKGISRNRFWVALLSLGEGWHDNHHRFMQSPYLGLKWYEIDMGKMVLMLLKRVGLVWGMRDYARLDTSKETTF